jgi:pyrroloquinoline quinone (PQQ) biosynthesis protein C
MTGATDLITTIRRDVEPLSSAVRNHRYIQALTEGKVPFDSLRIVAGEQYHIIKNDMRSFSLLLARQENADVRRFLLGSIEYEAAAFDALTPFAAALGMSEAALEAYEPLPGAHAYTAFLALTAVYGSAADMAGAFVVDLEGWGGNCRDMSRQLREKYDLTADQVAFFDHFGAEDPTFESRSLALIDRVLDAAGDREALERSIRRTARLMMSYELMYWDTLYEASVR